MPEPFRLLPVPRVSQRGDRTDLELLSPSEQIAAMQREADSVGITLLTPVKEINVSGTLNAADRPGIQATLEAIANGDADGCMFDNFDRGGRGKMGEIAGLITAAGGRIYAIGQGWLEYEDPDKRLIYDILDAVGGHLPRKTRKSSARAKRAAILMGRSPKQVPVGYDKDADKLLRRNAHAPHVLDAYRMRAAGATLAEVHAYLTSVGIKRSWYGVQTLLRQTDYTGDLIVRHLGETLTVPGAHDQIVPWDLFNEVQAMTKPSGRRAKSDYLLARLGVLKDHRGIPMVAGPAGKRTPKHYRTTTTQLAPGEKIVTIGAHLVEPIVWEVAVAEARVLQGKASLRAEARKLDAQADELEVLVTAKADALARATSVKVIEALAPQVEAGETSVTATRAEAARLHRQADRHVLDPDDPDLTLEQRRAIIESVIDRVVVVPAGELRGADRVEVVPFSRSHAAQ